MTDRKSLLLYVGKFIQGDLRSVHLELTTRCNARCPMCPRTGRGTARGGLALVDLSLADIRRIFPVPLLQKLERIDICGGFGDGLMARDFDEILNYFLSNGDLSIHIYTNGSLRTIAWWSQLGRALAGRGRVVFGIDGLSDTHHLYRVDTSFERIIENARAFMACGGKAQWDFLVFRHNQHQVDAARALATELGFVDFSAKVSGRFFKRYYEETPDLEHAHGHATFPVYDADGQHLRDLELPTDSRFRNGTLERLQAVVEKSGSLTPLLDAAHINCRAIDERSCFVSAEGTVFPCCWTYGASKYQSIYGMKEAENLRVAELLISNGGPDSINAKLHPLEEVVNGPFFRALEESWSRESIATGKTKLCARVCGGTFSQEDQFIEPALSPWRVGEREQQHTE